MLTNTFINLDKYIYQFEQIHLPIWTHAFVNLESKTFNFDKCISQF